MYRVAIVEDEDFYVNQIQDFIKQFSEEENEEFDVFVFRDGDTIASNYKAQFDIILMDVQMRFIDGMTAAQEIRKLDSEVVIIFITSRSDYAIKGYEVDALDYVLKPVTYFTFAQKLKKAVLKVSTKESKYVLINTAGVTKKVNVDDIFYLESHGHTIEYHTKSEAIAIRGSMSDMEKEYEPLGFYRINRGSLINLKYAQGIEENELIIGDERLPIARGKRKPFMDVLTKYISRTI